MQKTTRDKILESTIELLWRQSYGSVSVDDICHVSKVQKGSFYHYFPSKIDVVIEAFEKLWQDSRPIYDDIFSPARSPLERLDKFCEISYQKQHEKFEKFGKVLGCPYMSCGSELSTQDERVRRKMNEMFARSVHYMEELLRDAQEAGLTHIKDVPTTAQEMMSYISGVMYQAKLKNDVEIIRRDLKPGLLRYFNTSQIPAKTHRAASARTPVDA